MRVYLSEEDNEDRDYVLDLISTYGGEAWLDDDYELREYGIQLGDLTLSNISPEEIKELGVCIINHLLINGHKFEFYNDNRGNGESFRSL